MIMSQQSYANHTRFFPFLHYFVMPTALILLFVQGYRGLSSLAPSELILLVVVFLLICSNVAARLQALKAQDRVIRLEEFIRYDRILSSDVAGRAKELPVGTVVALRFASDDELPAIVGKVLDGSLKTSKEIKQAIGSWRADLYRV